MGAKECSENQGREESNYRKDKDKGVTLKYPKARAPLSLILLVAVSLCGLSGSRIHKSFKEICGLCFIQVPNPDPSAVASGLGSQENLAFPQ